MFEHLRSNGIFVDGRERDSRHVVGRANVAARRFDATRRSQEERRDNTTEMAVLVQHFAWNGTRDHNYEIT